VQRMHNARVFFAKLSRFRVSFPVKGEEKSNGSGRLHCMLMISWTSVTRVCLSECVWEYLLSGNPIYYGTHSVRGFTSCHFR